LEKAAAADSPSTVMLFAAAARWECWWKKGENGGRGWRPSFFHGLCRQAYAWFACLQAALIAALFLLLFFPSQSII
jgi:hypothetical protein